MAGLRTLLISFGIDLTGTKKLADADQAVVRLLGNAQGLGTALKSLGAIMAAGYLARGLVNFVSGTLEAADALFNQAAKLGMTTDELQAYQYAAAQFGITQVETAVAIRFFNRMIGEAQLGTKGAVKTMSQLGLSMAQISDPTMTTGKMLAIFSDKLEKMPNQFKRTAFVMRTLGRGGSSMLPLLQQGSKKIKEVFGDIEEMGGGFDQAFAQASHEFLIQLKKIGMGLRTVSAGIVKEMLPALKWLTESAMSVTKWFVYVANHTYGFRTALMVLGAALAVGAVALGVWLMAVYPILIPLAAFVALLGLLYLAFDDFYTFLAGGDSLFGRFIDRLWGGHGAAEAFRKKLVAAFNEIWAAIGPVIPKVKEFAAETLKAFLDTIPAIIEWGSTFTISVLEIIDMAVSGLRMLGNSLKAIGETFEWLFDLGNGKSLADIWGGAGGANDALTAGLMHRIELAEKLRDTMNSLGKPGSGKDADPADHSDGSSSWAPPNPGPGPWAPLDANGTAPWMTGVPAGGNHIQITNIVTPGQAPKTKVKVNGAAATGRNTFHAVTEGMPSTAD